MNDMAIDIDRELEMILGDENSNFGQNILFNKKNQKAPINNKKK